MLSENTVEKCTPRSLFIFIFICLYALCNIFVMYCCHQEIHIGLCYQALSLEKMVDIFTESHTFPYCQLYHHWGHQNVSLSHIDGLANDCSNSRALAVELLQSCTKPPIYWPNKLIHMSLQWPYNDQNGWDHGMFYILCSTYQGYPAKGPYLPCVSMADKALLAGYHRYAIWIHLKSTYAHHFRHIADYKHIPNTIPVHHLP